MLPGLLLGRRFPSVGPVATLTVIGWCALGVLLAAPGLRTALLAGYPGDSLYTLEPLQQLSVAGMALGLSLGLCLLVDWGARAAARRAERAKRYRFWKRLAWGYGVLGFALELYVIGFLLSPQLFYAYYRSIIPGLPAQWVIDPFRSLHRLGDAVRLAPDGSLAEHGAGVLLWTVVGVVVCRFVLAARDGGRD